MVPYLPLFITITMGVAPNCTAVLISLIVIWMSPSPATQTTTRSGCSSDAATAAGNP